MQTDHNPNSTSAPGEQDLPGLPSWSWAAIDGGKRFLTSLLGFQEMENSCEVGVCLLDPASGTVRTTAPIRPFALKGVSRERQKPSECCVRTLVTCDWAVEDNMMSSNLARTPLGYYSTYLVTASGTSGGQTGVWGFVRFDREVFDNFFILPLVLSPREEEDPM